MFSFYAGSEMNTEKVDNCFSLSSLLPACLVSHSNFCAILSVTQFSATLTSRPWIHGSTIITLLVPELLWISADPTGCIVIYQCNRLFGGNEYILRATVKRTLQWKKS